MSNSLSITTTFTDELPREMSQAAGKLAIVQCHFQSDEPSPLTATRPGDWKMMSRGRKSRSASSPACAKSMRETAGSRRRCSRASAASPLVE